MVHVMAIALVAIANRATTAKHVRRVFFIEISSLLVETKRKTRLRFLPSRDPITSPAFFFQT